MEQAIAAGDPVGARLLPRWTRLVAIAFGMLLVCQALAYTIGGAGLDVGLGDRAMRLSTECSANCFCRIETVTPNGLAARAGIRAGDKARLNRS